MATTFVPDPALLRLADAVRATGYHFVTVTPATHRRVNARPGNEWARDLPDVFGWSRPFRDGTLPSPIVDLMRSAGVLAPERDGWRSAIRLSTLDGAIFVHSAFPTDSPDAVFFGPDTYRFVAALTAHLDTHRFPIRRAVDIGCGAGPGAIALARRFRDAEVLMVDINGAALGLASVNAALAGAGNARPCRSDLLSAVDGSFDLIVANPPYLVDAGERAYRHGGGPLGAGLSLAIIEAAAKRLSDSGVMLLYTGAAIVDGDDQFRTDAGRCLDAAGLPWSYREIDPDVFGEELDEPAYARADRIAAVLVTATQRG